jgi:sporulation protein YlmC with PRC-barrel domain
MIFQSTCAARLALALCCALAGPLAVAKDRAADGNGDAAKAAVCHKDLQDFDSHLDKDGYWLGATGYGYGYPMDGYGYGYPMYGPSAIAGDDYHFTRPGHQVRVLLAAAKILASRGQQTSCEAVLAATRDVYQVYLAQLKGQSAPLVDADAWRRLQIGAAQPVTTASLALSSEQLLGMDVRTTQNQSLGSIDDLVLNPTSGKIAYLVIVYGGFLGIDEKRVPVPWEDFKITPSQTLLVIDSTAPILAAAPRVKESQLTGPGPADLPKSKIDAYWQTQFATAGK